MGITIYMGLNVDTMISRFGLLSFFSFFKDFLIYGNLFIVVLLIIENSHIWFLKRKAKHAENENTDLIIRANDLRRQVNEFKQENDK